jgi:hypothetical protein
MRLDVKQSSKVNSAGASHKYRKKQTKIVRQTASEMSKINQITKNKTKTRKIQKQEKI